ncbi:MULTISPECIES: helix-turn-helix domain-containing protein [Enterobacteriaceae]|uniref:helix-turn-helix domain-containing protein n=1 Tax=Enterobacteriaceae TaxID=543 RepID=UPI0003BE444E|nr:MULTISPECIES: AraC family transcriptional regulator [Enterobacteriaceae]ESL99149.1 hypothetical protein L419_02535 [Klebsiella pneumoniae UCICRE 8]MDT7455209.1 AraC family transcriptional regulator [Citrobacter koseri]MDT7503215.1 AraC family transcriptional regulator [Citrobacter koseri]
MKNIKKNPYDTYKEMTRVLDVEPELALGDIKSSLAQCIRWPHGPLHDVISPMDKHVIIAHLGKMQRIERITDNKLIKAMARERTITTIPQGSSSRWDLYGDVDVIHFYISPEMFKDLLLQVESPSLELVIRTAHYDTILSNIIFSISEVIKDKSKVNIILYEQLILSFFIQLINNHSTHTHISRYENCVLSPRSLKLALEKLDSCPVGDVTIKKLASELGLTSAYFCRAFKGSTGMTPYCWLKQRVMERAFIQLKKPRKKVIEIALESGYSSHTAFTNAFRKMTGLTPSQWRLQEYNRK